jgi:hypothetical protein
MKNLAFAQDSGEEVVVAVTNRLPGCSLKRVLVVAW